MVQQCVFKPGAQSCLGAEKTIQLSPLRHWGDFRFRESSSMYSHQESLQRVSYSGSRKQWLLLQVYIEVIRVGIKTCHHIFN